jgi:hypothetical protein
MFTRCTDNGRNDEFDGVSMAHQFEDGRNRDPREDDPMPPSDDETTGNPYHLSRGARTFLRIVAVILVVSMTALFLRGFIHT